MINQNTETVTVEKINNIYSIVVQHDQSGSAIGLELSEDAFNQLKNLIYNRECLQLTGQSYILPKKETVIIVHNYETKNKLVKYINERIDDPIPYHSVYVIDNHTKIENVTKLISAWGSYLPHIPHTVILDAKNLFDFYILQ